MTHWKARWVSLAGVLLLLGACEEASPTNSTNTGGVTKLGGAAATGGQAATGGMAATGGQVATGGMAAATGGQLATGGRIATGGQAATGGMQVTGGQAASGGVASSGGQVGGAGGTGGQANAGGSVGTGGAGTIDAGAGGPGSQDARGTGGSAQDAGVDTTPAGSSIWAEAYSSNCTPTKVNGRDESDGHHKAGENCMTSGCHSNPKKAHHNAGRDCTSCHRNGSPDGSGAPEFLFGGTAYKAGTNTGLAKVEVGVKSGSTLVVACSASNGNFWALPGSSITWSGSKTSVRTASGEAPMMGAPTAGCNANGCHTGNMRITAP